MDRYSYMDMLLNVKQHHPKQSEIQRFDLKFVSNHDPRRSKIPNYCAFNPLTRDLSGLGFVELQNGQVFTTCW